MTTSHDVYKNTEPSFKEKLDAITSRQLDARTINTYASEALEDLVSLVQEIIAADDSADNNELSGREIERRALKAVHLDPNTIEATLDHVSDVADSTRLLDKIIMEKTKLSGRVIVPPDPSKKPDITPGDGSFKKPKELIPKSKTLLLLLEKGLDIDITSDDVTITRGVVRPNMMRETSYNLVEISSLKRAVLVCDEVGNTTYVFDMETCADYGIDGDYLAEQMKSELNELIEQDSKLGRRIDYSKQYVDHLSEALLGEMRDDSGDNDKVATQSDILKPKAPPAPQGYLSVRGIRREYGFAARTIRSAITELGNQLGEVRECRFGKQTAPGYSPEQIQQILEQIGEPAPPAPEGYLAVGGIHREYGFDAGSITRAITALGDQLGEASEYRFGKRTTLGYSPDQQRQILEWIQKNSKRTKLGKVALDFLAEGDA